MTTQISCSYQVTAVGAVTIATLQAEVAAVPIPPVQLAEFGLRVLSDNTSSIGAVITRTIVLGMDPTIAASATASLFPGDRGSPIQSIAVGGGGSGYVQPPIVSFTGGAPRADENVPASAHAVLTAGSVSSIVIDNPGSGYMTPPTVVLTPLFHAMFPDGTDQASTVKSWLTGVLQQALRQPIVTLIPAVS